MRSSFTVHFIYRNYEFVVWGKIMKKVIFILIFISITTGCYSAKDDCYYGMTTICFGTANGAETNDKNGHILVGGESQVGDWSDSALFARDRTVDKAAEKLGYGHRIPPQKAPFNSHGQDVYWNGKNYITPDVDGHNISDGWKVFDRRGNRLGTYDKDLNRIKD